MNIMETKICSKCNRELSIDNFYKDNKTKDGLYCWCKECHSKYKKQHYKQHYKEYYKEYRQTHREHYNQYQKDYLKQFKGCYLYIIQDKNNEIVYVGQTSNYYTRLMNHLSENNDNTKELFANNEWACIKYLDVSNIVENEAELRALENALIELYEPRCNTRLNIIRDIDKGRLFNLIATLHSILNEWIVFKSNNN